ncbi:DUF2892 domain-containing protein [Salinibaculum salinum]|uniref:YgaP family membrane protein n=1 Tax=Salinibaculum salinum TaxID=3131996 RepID=UPI0030EE9B90
MEKNVGGYDRIARFVLGPLLVVLAVAAYGGYITLASGLLGATIVWAALAIGAVLIVTAATQMCPLNSVFGIDTYRSSAGDGTAETDSESESRAGRPM